VEMVVAPSIDIVKRGSKLGSGLGGVSAVRNLSRSSTLPTIAIGVVGIFQMVFIDSIIIIHVNRTANQPLMSSMAVRECRGADVVHSRGGYRKPLVVTALIFYHKDGHYVRPNRVALKHPNLKKNVIPDVHVKMFNSIAKANVETSKKYIIKVFNYTLRNITLN